jgi:serine/threonine protein kinase
MAQINSVDIVQSNYGWFSWFKTKRSRQSISVEIDGKHYKMRMYTPEELRTKPIGKVIDLLGSESTGRKEIKLNLKDFHRVERALGTRSVDESLQRISQAVLNQKKRTKSSSCVETQSPSDKKIQKIAIQNLRVGRVLGQGGFNQALEVESFQDTSGTIQQAAEELIIRTKNPRSRSKKIARYENMIKNELLIYRHANDGLTRDEAEKKGIEPMPHLVTFKDSSGKKHVGTLKRKYQGDLFKILYVQRESKQVTKQRLSTIASGVHYLVNKGIAPLDIKDENILANAAEDGKPPVTVLTDLGEHTVSQLYEEFCALNLNSRDVIAKANAGYLLIGFEPGTRHMLNGKFDMALVEAARNRNFEAFKTVIDKYVAYKTAVMMFGIAASTHFNKHPFDGFIKQPNLRSLLLMLRNPAHGIDYFKRSGFFTEEQANFIENAIGQGYNPRSSLEAAPTVESMQRAFNAA